MDAYTDAEVIADDIDIKRYLSLQKERIDQTLSACLERVARLWPPLLRESVDYSLMAGGKRIRPILALAGLECVGRDPEPALPLVCSLEFIHTYSLIHDDLPAMDNDDFRRGIPTNHKKYGEAIAILAGDALLTAAFTLLADPHWGEEVPPSHRLAAARELSLGAGGEGMVGGQLLDISLEGKPVDAETLRSIHARKTGALIRSAIRIGGILGGAKASDLNALTHFGERVGLAFQIADDILDVEGAQETLGKNTQRDQANQKNTYPALHGLERSKDLAAALIKEAGTYLEGFGNRADALRQIARFIVERKT